MPDWLAAISCDQPIDGVLMLLDLPLPDERGENAVLKEHRTLLRLLAFQLSYDRVPLLRELTHVGRLAVHDLAEQVGGSSGSQRPNYRSCGLSVCVREIDSGTNAFDCTVARNEIAGVHFQADALGYRL